MLEREYIIFGTKYKLSDLIKILLFVISILVSFCFWTVVLNAVFLRRPAEGAERVDCMAILCAAVPFIVGFGQIYLRRSCSLRQWGICTVISGTFTAVCCLIFFTVSGMSLSFGGMLFILLCSLAGCAASAGLFSGLRKGFGAIKAYVCDDADIKKKKADLISFIDIK